MLGGSDGTRASGVDRALTPASRLPPQAGRGTHQGQAGGRGSGGRQERVPRRQGIVTSPTVPEETTGQSGRACLPFSLSGTKPLADPHPDSPGLGWPDPSSYTHQTEPPSVEALPAPIGLNAVPVSQHHRRLCPEAEAGQLLLARSGGVPAPRQERAQSGNPGDTQPRRYPTPQDQSPAPANPAPPCCRQGKGGPPGPTCCDKRTRGSPAEAEGTLWQGQGYLLLLRPPGTA